MSHCTRFEFAYGSDDAIASTLARLGMKPTTGIVAWFQSDAHKRLQLVGAVGTNHQHAIIGELGGLKYFFVESGAGRTLVVESDRPMSSDVSHSAAERFQRAYVETALLRLREKFAAAGMETLMEIDSRGDYTLRFGPGLSKSVSVRVEGSSVVEEVAGVSGPSCADLTALIEEALSASTAELSTEWKTQYYEQIEDSVVQVLRL